MDNISGSVNARLRKVFYDILKLEQSALKSGPFGDLSVNEMHTIEAIGLHMCEQMSDLAKKLEITVGTLTVAINNLVKKEYVERKQSENDRRVVLVSLSGKGRVVYRLHQKFHKDIIQSAVERLSGDEQVLLAKSLSELHEFLSVVTFDKYVKRKK